jgi:hypothetical protein
MSTDRSIPFNTSRNAGAAEVQENRAFDVRRDDDTFKTPAISIYDIDYAVHYYLTKVIRPQIEEHERIIDVPINFASGESWAQIQKRGYMRDKQGKLLLPFGALRRTSMMEDDRFAKLDVNQAPLEHNVIIKQREERNFDNIRDRHSQTTNSQPNEEYFISVMPEFYRIEYDLIFYTAFTDQMNKIVLDIVPTSKFMWGDSFQFRTLVNDFSFETINPSNSERLVKASTTLTVDGRLQNEFELRKSTIQKAYTTKRVVFRTERSSFDFHVQ